MRTYVDSGVLITAARGVPELSTPAIAILTDAERQFVCSEWVQLEVLPKPRYFNRQSEIAFYEAYFQQVSFWGMFTDGLLKKALSEASVNGLSAVDAIHIVLAAESGCDELVTSEKPGSPIHRTRLLRVVSIW